MFVNFNCHCERSEAISSRDNFVILPRYDVYLKYFFQKIYHEIRLLAEGGAQPNLNVGKIKGTFIPIPPIPELEAIVEKVNSLMALCDSLEQEVKQSKDEVEKLMKAVLREVFEGEKECVNE
jgi:type I restriction enzyme S subunit